MKSASAVVVISILVFGVSRADAQARYSEAAIDKAVRADLKERYRFNSRIIAHLDLTQPFQTKSQWTLVIAKQPDAESQVTDGAGSPIGAISLCFVENTQPDCSEKDFLARFPSAQVHNPSRMRPFYEIFASDVVYAGAGKTLPLLRIKTCSNFGFNGDCGVSLYLFDYDRKAEKFWASFFNCMGRNNNQEARFVESGPLLGNVVVAYPTRNAPFTYFVEVHERKADGNYARALRYRGNTRYGDGNRLAVIDSEMPETLKRLGHWNAANALPVPPRMPRGCTGLVMRKDVLWCESR